MSRETPKRHPLFWNNELVGFIEDLNADMFHLYGWWIPADTPATQQFLDIIQATFEPDTDPEAFYPMLLRNSSESAESPWVELGEDKSTHATVEVFGPVELPSGETRVDIEVLMRHSPPQF